MEQISTARGLARLSDFIPCTAEWESSQQLSGTLGWAIPACRNPHCGHWELLWQRGRVQSQGLMPSVPKPSLNSLGALGCP